MIGLLLTCEKSLWLLVQNLSLVKKKFKDVEILCCIKESITELRDMHLLGTSYVTVKNMEDSCEGIRLLIDKGCDKVVKISENVFIFDSNSIYKYLEKMDSVGKVKFIGNRVGERELMDDLFILKVEKLEEVEFKINRRGLYDFVVKNCSKGVVKFTERDPVFIHGVERRWIKETQLSTLTSEHSVRRLLAEMKRVVLDIEGLTYIGTEYKDILKAEQKCEQYWGKKVFIEALDACQ